MAQKDGALEAAHAINLSLVNNLQSPLCTRRELSAADRMGAWPSKEEQEAAARRAEAAARRAAEDERSFNPAADIPFTEE